MQDQIQQHKEKWKIWNQQREKQAIKKRLNVEEGMENYAAHLIEKMSDPVQRINDKQAKNLSKKMNSQIQSNICSICLELMVPPEHHPMILFPCGHNLCKDCLFERPPLGVIKKGLKLKLQKCSLCRQKIQSYALNQSLMALICTYSNNKDLLQKQNERLEQQKEEETQEQNVEYIRIRCGILEQQKYKLQSDAEKFNKQKIILSEVIETLKKQKRKNQKQLQKIEEEGKLIAKCLNQKVEEMELLGKRIKEVTEKDRVVEKALTPLLKQKQKQQLLEIARLLGKK